MITNQIDGPEFLSAVLKTCGHYATEEQSIADMLSKVNKSHWTVYREVQGWLLHPRPFGDGRLNLRVDVMLDPTEHLQECGWRWGPIAIECKRSGSQVGPALCQVLDYTRCVWLMRNGEHVMSRLCFLWHLKPPGGTVASLMINNRIGCAFLRDYKRHHLVLMFNSTVAYEDRGCDTPRIANDLRGGDKTGSR